MSHINISGTKFGRLVAVAQVGYAPLPSGKRMQIWKFTCDCGKSIEAKKAYITSGDTSSCGCLRSESTSNLKRKHSLAHRTKTYNTWVLMRQRCNNPKATSYSYYGGRGVTVCARWDSFENFLLDMGERPSDKPTIDRVNPFWNYEPENCRWASHQEQAINKRKNHA